MGFWTVFVIAVGLSMDAFAVSVANGCRMTRVTLRDALRPGWWFGGFQMLMPVLGWLGGLALRDLIQSFGHWVAFGLLVFIGGKMLVEAVRGGKHEDECEAERRSTRDMLVLAIATSIDALAVGLSLSVLRVSIWWPCPYWYWDQDITAGVALERIAAQRKETYIWHIRCSMMSTSITSR